MASKASLLNALNRLDSMINDNRSEKGDTDKKSRSSVASGSYFSVEEI